MGRLEIYPGFIFIVPIGIQDRRHAAFKNKQDLTGIFALNDRIEAHQVCVDFLDFTEQKAEGVDEVNAGYIRSCG